ncbi:hypothetical protein [Rathayibacter sp. VKM Ac-2857]|uniref:hypothetical protein n=1 Tax=Rathayibacter sp. VKM Ac-2857 TaxID=2739020 RepID=UPI001563BCBA|nr:hypothetical protein [Rathayibacter sp. VKM Ac-2857]NQX16603.1 hypothetical protein [Rathayibacter sp. VKM Ac-2857]
MKQSYMAALCVGLVLAGAIAQPAVADASESTVVTGTLTLPDGSPVVGTSVSLEAWPAGASLGALSTGDPVNTYTAGADITGPNGEYSISFDDPSQLPAYADSTGTVNFVVQAAVGGSVTTFDLSRKLPSSLSASAAPTVAPLEAQSDPGTNNSASAESSNAKADPQVAAGQVGCGWALVQNLGPKWVQVGEAYTAIGTSASFNYTSSASSQLGVGVSQSGNAGTWSASGTNSVSSSSSVGMPTVSGASGRLWKTQFNYGKFGYACAGSGYQNYQTKATSFAGGSTWSTAASPPSATYCVTQAAGSSFTKNSTSATTFSAGAAVGLGINMSAQTGFSTSTALTFSFSATHKLCGSNAYPGNSPARLVAKP